MTTTTTFFQFPDEATAITALAQYRNAHGWITGSHVHALDPVGTLYTPPVLDGDGNVTTPAQPLPGWHANLIGAVPAAATQYVIGPNTPHRLYAGSSWAQAAPLLQGQVTPGLYQDVTGIVWRVIQAYNAAVYTDPTKIPALVRKLRPPGRNPWVQPIDQYDAFRVMNPYTGAPDECTHSNKMWRVSAGDGSGNNVWEPGVYGWDEIDADGNVIAPGVPPPVTPAPDAWPEFVQPTGAQDAYAKGAQITFEGAHYVSLIDANVWSPTAYPAGWQKAA